MRRLLELSLLALLLSACGDSNSGSADAGALANRKELSRAEALDPKQCKNCHPNHYREWASSMHAYASKDPVFIAMNKRGQAETNGQLGNFCVNCHAPMAVHENKVPADNDTSSLPDELSGVTCYFCHNAKDLDQTHTVSSDGGITTLANNPVVLADDVTMRGPIIDPKQPRVHVAAFSDMFNDGSDKSSAMCGGCHDIVTPSGVHLERTFEEYKQSIFSRVATSRLSCSDCHMEVRANEPAADDPPSHVPVRKQVHSHLWPGVDVALTDDFPDRDVQKLAIQCFLNGGALTYSFDGQTDSTGNASPGAFTALVETQAGHRQPSGASQDRRMWYEFLAYDAQGQLMPQASSGMIADGDIEEKNPGDQGYDPALWLFRDRIYDASGNRVHMFWQAAPSAQHPDGYDIGSMRTTVSSDMTVLHTEQKTYQLGLTNPAKIVAHLRIRPIGIDVLHELHDTGYLSSDQLSQLVAAMPTFTLSGTETTWHDSDGATPVMPDVDPGNCPNSYFCLLQPGSSYCSTSTQQ